MSSRAEIKSLGRWRPFFTLLVAFGPTLVSSASCAPSPEPLSGQEAQIEARPEACSEWTASTRVGALDVQFIMESSGLEVSDRFPNRLYHINDSGDSGRFYVSDLDGSNTRTVEIQDFDPVDTEDIAIGECGLEDGQCLFIGDIGDNAAQREEVEILVVREQAEFGAEVAPLHRIRIGYREGPQDAESLAIDPEGNLYIVTKSADYQELTVRPSNVYRIGRADWLGGNGRVLTREAFARLDLTAISSDIFSGSLPTAADISDDGRRLLLLTYTNAFEFYVEIADEDFKPAEEMVKGVDYREINIETLGQQESAAYVSDGTAFMYTTELVAAEGNRPSVPIMRVDCRD